MSQYCGYTKYKKSSNDPTQDFRNASSPSTVCWGIIRNGLTGMLGVLKERKWGEKVELCQITQEMVWKSVGTVLMEGWIQICIFWFKSSAWRESWLGGCISVSGVRDLVKIDEIKEEEKYSQIWQFTPCSDILKLSVWQWLRFSPWLWYCQFTKRIPERKNTQCDTVSHVLASPKPRPQRSLSSVGSSCQSEKQFFFLIYCIFMYVCIFWVQ